MIDSTRAFAKLVAAFNQNDWPRVQQRTAQLFGVAPDDARLHFMAGIADMQLGELPQALVRLKKATHLAPRRADYVAQYAKALGLLQRTREARLVADRAMTLAPSDALTLDTLGLVYAQANAPIQSATAFRRAAALMPEHAPSRYNLAQALGTLGDDEGMVRELEACVQRDPQRWHAWLELAQARTQTTVQNHVDRLQSMLAEHASDPVAPVYLHMALGKELDDLGDHARAFMHFTQGKAACRRLRPFDAGHDSLMFETVLRAFPDALEAPAADTAAHGPIFLVGLPCTGISQLAYRLRQHPQLRVVHPATSFPALLQQASGARDLALASSDLAQRLHTIDWAGLGQAYLAATRNGADANARRVDPLPYNFLHAGFIARALPDARIVCLHREPLDACLANFRHLLEQPSPWFDYSHDLMDIGRHVIGHERLLAHWRQVLPGRFLELSCETLHHDPEPALRHLLDFCQLPWHDACLRPPPTIASHAIGKLGQWRHYAEPLRGLRQLLANAGLSLPG